MVSAEQLAEAILMSPGGMPLRGGSNQMLTAEDVAEALQVSVDTVYRKWRAWGLKGHRVGRLLRFRERDITTWLEKHAA
jgi:excisionase family DNA binding protein